MQQIAYLSTATHLMKPDQLAELLNQCRVSNIENKISGILLHHGGNFLQVLEGPSDNVSALYKKITQDPRHTYCLEVVNRKIDERMFGDWSMGFKKLSDEQSADLPGFNSFLQQPLDEDTVSSHRDQIFDLLIQFKTIHLAE